MLLYLHVLLVAIVFWKSLNEIRKLVVHRMEVEKNNSPLCRKKKKIQKKKKKKKKKKTKKKKNDRAAGLVEEVAHLAEKCLKYG